MLTLTLSPLVFSRSFQTEFIRDYLQALTNNKTSGYFWHTAKELTPSLELPSSQQYPCFCKDFVALLNIDRKNAIEHYNGVDSGLIL